MTTPRAPVASGNGSGDGAFHIARTKELMTGTRTRITRLVVAVVFALPVLLSVLSLSSLAAPSARGGRGGQGQKLAGLQHDFEVLAEQYNDAKYRLALIERKLAESRDQREAAERQARVPRSASRIGPCRPTSGPDRRSTVCSGAESIGEFSDRLEFMGAVAEGDAADRPRRRRTRGSRRTGRPIASPRPSAERQQQVASIENQLDRLDSMIDEQASLYEELNQDRQEYLAVVAAQRAALAAGPPGGGTGHTARHDRRHGSDHSAATPRR